MEKREKKEKKVRNIKKFGAGKNTSSLLFALLALVLTIIAFGGLLFLQSLFKEDVTYKAVVVAKADIPENEIITTDNATTYFEIKNMNILDTMAGSMSSIDEILGGQAKVPMYAGEIITAKDFRMDEDTSASFENPVEISISVGDVASSDGGKIRAGDVVNISLMFDRQQLGLNDSLQSVTSNTSLFVIPEDETEDEETIEDDFFFEDEEDLLDEELESEDNEEESDSFVSDKVETVSNHIKELSTNDLTSNENKDYVFNYYAEYVLQNVRVIKALDDAGTEIAPTDTTSVASILVFVIEKDQELAVNNAISNCANIRVSKVISKEVNEIKTADSTEENTDDVDETEAENVDATETVEESEALLAPTEDVMPEAEEIGEELQGE